MTPPNWEWGGRQFPPTHFKGGCPSKWEIIFWNWYDSTGPGGAPTGAAWTYAVVGKRSGAVTAGICTIVAGDGSVRATTTSQPGDVCEVTATASLTGYADKSAATVAFDVRGNIDLTWTGYTSNNVKLSDTAPTANNSEVTSTPSTGITLTYSVHADTTRNSCTVDSFTGVLTLQHAGTCVIQLTASATNYKSAAATFTVTVAKGVQARPTLVGGGPYQSFAHYYGVPEGYMRFGRQYSIVNVPTGGGGHGSIVYTVRHSKCRIDRNTGTLWAVSSSGIWPSCGVAFYWSGNDDWRASPSTDWRNFDITLEKGQFRATDWGNVGNIRINTSSTLTPVGLDPADATKVWSLADNSAGCTVDDTGTVTGTTVGVDTCRVKLTLSKQHYTTQTETYTISILGSSEIGILEWGDYQTGFSYGDRETVEAPTVTGVLPANADKSYAVKGTDTVCSVNTATGEATVLGGGTCTITLTLSRTGFTDKTHSYSFDIGKLTMGSFTTPVYNIAQAENGINYPVYIAPSGTIPDGGTLTYQTVPWFNGSAYTQAGEGWDTSYSQFCFINSQTGAVRFSGERECAIRAKITHPGYHDRYSPRVHLKTTHEQVTETTTVTDWGSYPRFTRGDTTGVAAPALTGLNPTGARVAYTLASNSSGCSVTVDGTVTGTVGGSGQCRVVAVAVGGARYQNAVHTYEVHEANIIGVSDWGSYGTTFTFGGQSTVSPPTVTGVAPADAARNWAVVGTASVCSVNAAGAATILGAGTCTITLTLSKNSFADRSRDYSFTVEKGTIEVGNWGSYGTVHYGSDGAAPTLAGLTPADTGQSWAVNGTAAICRVNGTSGVLTPLNFGNCRITLTLTKNHYTTLTRNYDVYIRKGNMGTLTIPVYNITSTAEWSSADIHLVPQGAPAGSTFSYQIKRGGTLAYNYNWGAGCGDWATIDGDTGTISFASELYRNHLSACQVRVNVSHPKYNSRHTPGIEIKLQRGSNPIAVSGWGNYSSVRVGRTVSPPSLSGLDPADARKIYSLADNSTGCTVTSDGVVTGTAVGTGCRVRLTLESSGHYIKENTYTVSVLQ